MPADSPVAEDTVAEDPKPAELVARLISGDQQAETELVERYQRGLRFIIERHTAGRPEAQDLLQDALSLGLDKVRRGELRDPSKLGPFLSQLARNIAIEHYRKAHRRKTDADSEVVADRAVTASSQLQDVLASEQAQMVRQVIAELRNERDRQIIFRFYIAEDDKAAIADDLGLTAGQFNRVLHRARGRYKELYQQHLQRLAAHNYLLLTLVLGAMFWRLMSLAGQEL